jgi:hypothetical protein
VLAGRKRELPWGASTSHPKGSKGDSLFFLEAKLEAACMNPGLFIGIVALFALLFLRDYFFGPKDIDDKRGFPWSRKKKK